MKPRLLLDTHVLVRWLIESKRLSRKQAAALGKAVERAEPVAISAITLLEVAVLAGDGRLTFKSGLEEFMNDLRGDPVFRVLPLSYEVAVEAATLTGLRDPADRTIVATARTHRLTLVTSDSRIIDSGLVAVIE